uniref:CBS domain-containing protein n=1 Tax=Aegilops tauschii subsp. strangulata TaxID=200361 RepID=A0A453A8M8_AEGTS
RPRPPPPSTAPRGPCPTPRRAAGRRNLPPLSVFRGDAATDGGRCWRRRWGTWTCVRPSTRTRRACSPASGPATSPSPATTTSASTSSPRSSPPTRSMSPTAKLGEVMSRPVEVATPDQRLAEIDALFATQSGLPVVDGEGRCIGVVSKKDKARASNGLDSTIGEVMSSPAVTLTLEKTVLEAAALMLKHKVHRIPVVNEQQQVIGKNLIIPSIAISEK